MTKRKRWIKIKVVVAASKGDKKLAESAQQFDVHPNQITDCKSQLLERSAQIFGGSASKSEPSDTTVMRLKIAAQTLGNDFLQKELTKLGLLNARR